MIDAVCDELGWVWSHATQPHTQRWLRPEHAGVWDTILLHDLPGLTLRRGVEPTAHDPDDSIRSGIRDLLAAGQGIVATHHALAGWPTWDEWADLLGGRFFYGPGRLHGVDWPASGYRMDTYDVSIVAPEHPVCRGVEPFVITDELYLCCIHEPEVVPLLRTGAALDPERMIDTYREVCDGTPLPVAAHPPGSSLLGWAKRAAGSPLVYLLPGHRPETMLDAHYRQLLANSVGWVASDAAVEWAASPAAV